MTDEIILKKLQALENGIQSIRGMLIPIKGYLANLNKRITDMEKKNGNK